MMSSFDMFLLVAEELNFSRAAKQAFISQQAMSDHIKRLETTYKTQLFYRRPHLQLTPAGEIMRQTLMQLQIQLKDMVLQIEQVETGVCGDFVVGINRTRAQILLPKIFPKFHEAFPLINLQIVFGDTIQMKEDLLDGKLDAFLGVNVPIHPHLQISHVYSDTLYLFLSDKTMRQYFVNSYPECLIQFRKGINLQDFAHIPSVQLNPPSTLAQEIKRHCVQNHIKLNSILTINDFDSEMNLCASMPLIAFCPSMFIYKILNYNSSHCPEERLHAFPISILENVLSVDMVTHKNISISAWLQTLTNLIIDECEYFSFL